MVRVRAGCLLLLTIAATSAFPLSRASAQTVCIDQGAQTFDGYCRTPYSWQNPGPIHYRVNPNTNDVSGEEEAVRRASHRWNDDPNSDVELIDDGTTTITHQANDGVNAVFWAPDATECQGDANTLGCAIPQPPGCGNNCTGFDMELIDNHLWSIGSPQNGGVDIQSVAEHEFGHWLELDHPDDFDQVMCTGCMSADQSHRALGWGDLNGVHNIWPDGPQPTKWTFMLRNSNSSGSPNTTFVYGDPSLGDIPIVGDWDGNGTVTPGVVRPDSSGHWTWLLRNSNSGGPATTTFSYGNRDLGDIPIVGDWDGIHHAGAVDGTTIGVARPESGSPHYWDWLLRNSNIGGSPDYTVTAYGSLYLSQQAVVGDWNGGTLFDQTIGVTGPDASNELQWQLSDENNGFVSVDHNFLFGSATLEDRPVAGHWDIGASRNQGPGVVRPTTDGSGHWEWIERDSPSGGSANHDFTYGSQSLDDVPVTGDWNGNANHIDYIGVVRPTT
jgi:hypothetical protein